MQVQNPPVLALAALLMLAVSGCVGGSGLGVFAGPTGVPLDAPSRTGAGDFSLRVRVIAEGGDGEALVGAPVVIHHIPKPATAPTFQQLLRTNATLGGRTGADGILVARLDEGETYSFLTAVPNWTTEARHLVKITDEFRDKTLDIAVFKNGMTLEHRGKIPLTVRPDTPFINLGYANAKWWPVEVRFGDNATHRQYLHRLHAFEATLTVTNPPGTHANIHMRAVLSSDGREPLVWDARGAGIPPPNPNVKRIILTAADLANVAGMKEPLLRIGPMTLESTFGPECVPWDLQIQTGFDTGPRPPARRAVAYATGPDPGLPQPPMNC